MTRDEIEQFFARRGEAWALRDHQALARDHALEGTVESLTSGNVSGRDSISEIYRTWFAAFPDLQLQRDDLLVDGDRVALFWTVVGTHVGEFAGLAATGRRFKIRGVFIYTLEGSTIRHERRLYDFTGLLLQIGVLKARPE